jgi:hypothetical protein
MFHTDVDEYYYIIRGWCVYYYRTYILSVGVGFFKYFTYRIVPQYGVCFEGTYYINSAVYFLVD